MRKILLGIIGFLTLSLAVALGIAYLDLGMTERVERGCTLFYICSVVCVILGIDRWLGD